RSALPRLRDLGAQRLRRREGRRAHQEHHQCGKYSFHRPVSHHFELIFRATLVPQCTSPSLTWKVSQSSTKWTSSPSAPSRLVRSALNGSLPPMSGPNGSASSTLPSTCNRFTVPG